MDDSDRRRGPVLGAIQVKVNGGEVQFVHGARTAFGMSRVLLRLSPAEAVSVAEQLVDAAKAAQASGE